MNNNIEISELAFLLSAVMKHKDCPDWLKEAVLNATIENFDNRVVTNSPDFFEQMIFGRVVININ